MRKWLAHALRTVLAKQDYHITRPMFHAESEIDLRALLADKLEVDGNELSVVQIGANDGITNDPIHHLVTSRNWSLLAVEPNPAPFRRLCQNYKDHSNVRCAQCVVGAEDGETFLYFVDPGPQSNTDRYDQLASLSKDVLQKHWRTVPNLEKRICSQRIRSTTLKSLLAEFAIDHIHMLQVDTEGFDYEILKMAFAADIFPDILAFEWEHLAKDAMWLCRGDLIRYGYRWLIVKGDVVAIRDKQSSAAN